MHPAYFAMAMATGIVSIACNLLGLPLVARGLFWLNVAIYATLWALTALRVARYPAEVLADLTSHGRGVGFFTVVAATCVLGSQSLVVGGMPRVALGLWIAGLFRCSRLETNDSAAVEASASAAELSGSK
jgi:tellurite resistance protein TehA-like permease